MGLASDLLDWTFGSILLVLEDHSDLLYWKTRGYTWHIGPLPNKTEHHCILIEIWNVYIYLCYIESFVYIVSDYIACYLLGSSLSCDSYKTHFFFQASQVRLEPVFRIVDTRMRQRSECRDHSLSPSHMHYRVLRMRSQWLIVFCI